MIPLPFFEIDLSNRIEFMKTLGEIKNEVPIMDIDDVEIEYLKQTNQIQPDFLVSEAVNQ